MTLQDDPALVVGASDRNDHLRVRRHSRCEPPTLQSAQRRSRASGNRLSQRSAMPSTQVRMPGSVALIE